MTLTCHGYIYKGETQIPKNVEYLFYAEEGEKFYTTSGTELWNDLCDSTSYSYKEQLANGYKAVYKRLEGSCSYPFGVWLAPAELSTDGFKDGVYVHTGQKMRKDAPPLLRLQELKGFDNNGITLQNALLALQERFGDTHLVVNGMHCLTRSRWKS